MYCDIPLLGRCCFCLPLRRGVLIFGYLILAINVLFITIYSMGLHYDSEMTLVYRGVVIEHTSVVNLLLYLVETLFTLELLYAAHMSSVMLLKWYYYFSLTTTAGGAVLVISSCIGARLSIFDIEAFVLISAGFFLQIYLTILVHSLVKKLQGPAAPSPPQLQPLQNPPGVYCPTTEPDTALLV